MSLENLYDNYYESDRERKWYEAAAVDKARNIVEFCSSIRPRRALDIGAGNGAVTERVLDAGIASEMDAVEISDSGLNELRKRLGGRLRDIRRSDGLRLPYPDDEFDLAILSHVVEHVEHPRLLLFEARRVARHVYVEVPLEDAAFKSNLRGDFVMDTTGHINYYNRHTIKRLLQTSGWRVLRSGTRVGSDAPYRFQMGAKGVLHHRMKAIAFRLLGELSEQMFVFHHCLVCERGERMSISLGDVLDSRPAPIPDDADRS